MHFNLSTCLVLLAAPLALAVPFKKSSASEPSATSADSPKGGLDQIVSDHNKFVSDPASAKVPIPASENNAAREGHRQAHVALGPAGRFVPHV